MKKQPLKYKMNVIGCGLIMFLLIRTYIPVLGLKLGLNKYFRVWIIVYSLTLIFSCMVPISFIESMCDFHPAVFVKKKFDLSSAVMVPYSMFILIWLAIINRMLLSLLENVGISFPPSELLDVQGAFNIILYFIFTAVIPAVFEELFLRGIVLNLLLPDGKAFAIVTSAFVFMIMHTQVQSFLPVFAAGVILACIYLYTGDIRVSMCLHFVNNAYSFIMMYMQSHVNGISYTAFAVFVMLMIITLGIGAFIYMSNNKINIFAPLKNLGNETRFFKIFNSPVFILAFAGCLTAIISQFMADIA